ncbi:hypothetical protein [Nitrosomonas ureae]|uniref:hypothetical protein n=1 Tax=Nitrosomonas ureae TaxID=44577 RepID=UPI000BE32628|nr:hypothetical protein [Nitrosomonas ureae]
MNRQRNAIIELFPIWGDVQILDGKLWNENFASLQEDFRVKTSASAVQAKDLKVDDKIVDRNGKDHS